MKRLPLLLTLLLACSAATAQQYSFTFRLDGCGDTVLYLAQPYRDEVRLVDSATLKEGAYRFVGKRQWERGIYLLVHQDRRSRVGEVAIDGSRRFTLSGDAKLTPASVKVQGCETNRQMFDYMATVQAAQKEMADIRERKKDPAAQAEALAAEEALNRRMQAYEAKTLRSGKGNLFFRLVSLCDTPQVPDSVEDKPLHFRTHYWDALFADPDAMASLHGQLLHSPQLFNKMNYFFFGVLYHAEADTIMAETDRLMARIGDDTALARYVLDFITPRYFRSTKNIGWDAVWCHLASTYYLQGRCPWARESELYNMRVNLARISQSLIGAHGQELWMADTNQSPDPKQWISSHRFPTRYVILWFWDPDCHHCQEQSAQLKTLYDSLQTAPDRRFEVYAVGYEADVEKWKRYVREHDFRWVNVGGPNVNIDYQEAYNVHGAPTMIILDERRDIIMNKVLPIKSLLPFLDEHEKRQTTE